jgi:hypothetical protein
MTINAHDNRQILDILCRKTIDSAREVNKSKGQGERGKE